MRHHGTARTIDYTATLEFFESRGRGASPTAGAALTATMYQDAELATRRDQWERETVRPLLALRGNERVLDIGCGTGRWAAALHESIGPYLGVDFSAEMLRLAAEAGLPGCVFQQLAAQDVAPETLSHAGPYDLVICSGILIYLNDADVVRLARGIAAVTAPDARLYLREPMALGQRLTLDRFPSAELQQEYSAIYRTEAECIALLDPELRPAGFSLSVSQSLYPPELCNRTETEQHIQLWSRTS